LNVIGGDGSTSSYALSTGRQYTYAAVVSPTQIIGSPAGSDTVLASGGVTYDAGAGGSDRVVFAGGDNLFFGGSAPGDTISGGAGSDTIDTGTQNATVFSGTGNTTINLGDTVGGDVVALLAGNSSVTAAGVNDTVFATAAYDSTTGTIVGGTGQLFFVAGASDSDLPLTVIGGSGSTYMFTNAGSDITLDNSGGAAYFIAGAGNETLNGANAAGGFAFFSDTVAADAASINYSVLGGAGPDFFSTGEGHETIVAGSGEALFHVNDLGPDANITIADLQAKDFVNLGGLSVQDETALLGTASVISSGNLTVTLHDGTKVEFLGVTSLTGHLT
jgi:hypothetical protein